MNKNIKIKNNLPYIFMALPAVILFVTFFILPLIFTAKFSFYNWNNYSPEMRFIGLENYKKILSDQTLFTGIKNALIYAFSTVVLQSLIALPISVLLNKEFKGRNIYGWL